ncbi:hypothetical protein [Thiolapillus sp.]|uniref:hypothetical protein n=1 Tax=Thiolapillus sp. TaxID=2017437 RepID=UPI00263B51B9|nr:hypothetical protein [Thiolapillus sp.]
MPQPSWSPSTTQQLRKLVAAPYLPPNNWTPRLDAYFASPLALCARRVSSAASRLLGLPAFASLSMAGSVGNARATQERRTALHPGIGCLEAMAFPGAKQPAKTHQAARNPVACRRDQHHGLSAAGTTGTGHTDRRHRIARRLLERLAGMDEPLRKPGQLAEYRKLREPIKCINLAPKNMFHRLQVGL